jgi:hypothetical protein
MPSVSFYFTATNPDGSLSIVNPGNCSNWTVNTPVGVESGCTDSTTYGWTYYYMSCSQSQHLLCLQTGKGPSLQKFASAGKMSFVTSAGGSGDLGGWPQAGGKSGLEAADAICNTLALEAGLTGAFKAWLSSETVNAKDRFTGNGPWIRLDGVKIADNLLDLTDGSLFSAITITEEGDYIYLPVWTGTKADGTSLAGYHCSNWTDGTSTFSSSGGRSSDAYGGWTNAWSPVKCNYPYHLYCLED